ncbi:MAG: hypothetical protein NUW01_08035 [Gemmatimonadaceae bacterium]|nr:hypothetical protein [Gemmatimonadaceae bacterium]
MTGQGAADASLGLSDRVRGIGGSEGAQPSTERTPDGEQSEFEGLGELLTADDETQFKTTDDLVARQEILATNRWWQDAHWKAIKGGYTWSTLEKTQDQNTYKQVFPPGAENKAPSAVPNKAADLCNKLVEVLNTDPPIPSPQALVDSEEAERAAELAAQFLKQDGSDQGTDDESLFWCQTDLATTSSTAYLYLWTDRTGGGWTPTQIRAHPQAVDANNPLVGPDGQPTTDYILRYVTEDGQFTEQPSQAARTWLPKIRAEKHGREHWRLYPEDKDLNQCEAAVGLLYCTLGEAKRRWDTVAELGEAELAALCDWTPRNAVRLLPPALRARWKITTGNRVDPKGSSSDERVMFYYAHYRRTCPDYPEGMELFVNGSNGGFTLGKGTLSAKVQVPSGDKQDQTVEETRLLEIPLVAIRLIQDADDRDPTGLAFMARIGSSSEAQARLATAYFEAIDKILHPARFSTATSPVESWQVEESRDSGAFVPVLSAQDYPKYEEPVPLPGSMFNLLEWNTEQLNSIASLPKPAQGADSQQEVSGVARRIAVGQANISLGRMHFGARSARTRFWMLKLGLAMKDYNVPQLLRFVGEDGAYKMEWFTGVDFAKVTGVEIKAGTGTMMPPQEKVQYVAQMAQLQFMSAEEAGDAARPTFTQTLGIPADPQQQRIERQVSSWLEGPPDGWLEQAQQQAQTQASPAPTQNTGQVPPAPVALPALWSPFAPLAPDDEPQVAIIRLRRLRRLLGTVRFGAQDKLWQKVALDEYSRMRKAVADSAGAAQKAEADQAIAMEQAKAQGAAQAAQMQAQVDREAKQQELQATIQADQQKLQAEMAGEQQKLAVQAQADQAALQLETEKLETQHRLDMEKLAAEQAFELRKMELQASIDLQLQEAAAADAKETAKIAGEEKGEAEKKEPKGDSTDGVAKVLEAMKGLMPSGKKTKITKGKDGSFEAVTTHDEE